MAYSVKHCLIEVLSGKKPILCGLVSDYEVGFIGIKLYSMWVVKTCWYVICWALWMFYNDYSKLMDLLVILWALDNITWMLKYHRLWRLTSKWLWYGTSVKTIMIWIPFIIAQAASAYWLDKNILSFSFAILSFAEFISILQNLKVAKTGIEETENDVITKILDWALVIWNKTFERLFIKLQTCSKTFLDKKVDEILDSKK